MAGWGGEAFDGLEGGGAHVGKHADEPAAPGVAAGSACVLSAFTIEILDVQGHRAHQSFS